MSGYEWGSFKVTSLITHPHGKKMTAQDANMTVNHVSGMGADEEGYPVSVAISLQDKKGNYYSIHLSAPQIMRLAQCLIWDLENHGQEDIMEKEEDKEEDE